MNPKINIYALHGFLGRPHDWELLPILKKWDLKAVDLYESPIVGLEQWAADFCSAIDPAATNILIGYSLGGRLALHCIHHNPTLWKGAIFLSTHPGLSTDSAKQDRLMTDRRWAKKFETLDWKPLMDQWNAQTIFDQHKLPRNEKDYSRTNLSKSILNWSLGKQCDFRNILAKVSCPILWVTGEQDQKFTSITQQLTFQNPLSAKRVLPKTSHRLLWESSQGLEAQLLQFITSAIST